MNFSTPDFNQFWYDPNNPNDVCFWTKSAIYSYILSFMKRNAILISTKAFYVLKKPFQLFKSFFTSNK